MKSEQLILRLFGLGLLFFVASMIWGPGLETLLHQFEFGPFFSGLTLGVAVVAVGLCPGRQEAVILALACLAVEVQRIFSQWNPAFVGVVTVTGARAAVVGGLHLLLSAGLRPQLRRRNLVGLAHALTLPLLYAGSAGLQKNASSAETLTYDLFYYAADLRLGPPWCFRVFSWTHLSFAFYTFGYLAYFSLSHFMGVSAAIWYLRPRGLNPNLYFSAGALFGVLGYGLAPGVGPQVTFQKLYPFDPPPMDAPQLILAYPGPPRNTMPSLHLFWAYSCWVCLSTQGFWLEAIGLAYLLTMPLVAFLGSHYLVDYLATLPATAPVHLAVLWLSCRVPPDPTLRYLALAAGLFAPAYLALLVVGSPFWLVDPWMLKLASLAALILTVGASRRLRTYLRRCAPSASRLGSDPNPA
ncbi:MAG: hypothetical protein U0931_17185 [Vulcanimicrobiota bacterium]